jgi:hypothetical protein
LLRFRFFLDFFHLCSFLPLPYLFHPSHLSSVFIQYFSPFRSFPLPHCATSISHVLDCLSLLMALHSPSFLSFHPIPVFSLLVPTCESRHHFPFSCTFSPQVLRNFLCHTPLIFPDFYLDSLIFSSFHSALLIPFVLNLSTSSLTMTN